MFYYTALVSLASVLFYGYAGFSVGRARVQYGVKAPAVTGDPMFERLYRIQMNMLEWLPIQLVSLWLFSFYISDLGAAALGLAWIAGRVIYGRAYLADPASRSKGFFIQMAATCLLGFGALGDILARILLGD